MKAGTKASNKQASNKQASMMMDEMNNKKQE